MARALAYVFLGMVVFAPSAAMLSWSTGDSRFYSVPKLFLYPAIALSVAIWARRRFPLHDWIVVYVAFWGSVVILMGLLFNEPGRAFFAHIQAFLVIVAGFSCGYSICRNGRAFLETIERGLIPAGLALVCVIVVYYMLHLAGVVAYFGVSSLIALPLLFALSQRRYSLAALFFMAAFMTGKRVVILASFAVLCVYSAKYFVRRPASVGAAMFVAVALLWWRGEQLKQLPILRRLSFLWQNEGADLDTITSGRVSDAMSALDAINENPAYWIIGRGAGATFDVPTVSETWVTHYTHFSPLSYIFLGGLLLAVPLYVRLGALLFSSIRRINDFYEMAFVYYLLASFAGALMFSDPFFWIFAGIAAYRARHAAFRPLTYVAQARSDSSGGVVPGPLLVGRLSQPGPRINV